MQPNRSILMEYAPTQAKGLNAAADYLEAVFEMSKLPNTADETLRSRARKRFDELREYAAIAVKQAGFPSWPSEIATAVIRERRVHRRKCEQKRRERIAQRELLTAAQ